MNENSGRFIDSWFVVLFPSLFLVVLFILQCFFNELVELFMLFF
ncbi:hypothetical protein ACQVQY_27095 [Bacillus mycoides]